MDRIRIGGRVYEVFVPDTSENHASMVFFHDTITGVTSMRFIEDIETENGCIADGQERRLISSYLDNFEIVIVVVSVSVVVQLEVFVCDSSPFSAD